jgi:hypothetical protein
MNIGDKVWYEIQEAIMTGIILSEVCEGTYIVNNAYGEEYQKDYDELYESREQLVECDDRLILH